MAGDKDTLLSMGFDPARVEWALKATGNRGLQPAMDHIIEHESDPVPDLSSVSTQTSSSRPGGDAMDVDDDDDIETLRSLGVKVPPQAASSSAEDAEAKSIKCSECGKVFKNTALANYHAEKSGHDQFEESTEEIKPLTEEEKKQKLAELREKMAQKRAVKAVQEAEENKVNEALRRKAGKDLGKLREEVKAKEAIKEAEAKRRGKPIVPLTESSSRHLMVHTRTVEKLEDAKARAAIKAQIEADKKARQEKAAREKALREGKPIPQEGSVTPSAAAATPASSSTTASGPKEYKETRLQIRLSSGGTPYTTTLPSDSPLSAVAEFLASQNLSIDADTVTLTQQFPRKTFSRDEFSKSLKDLGLTPSAALIASTP